MRVLKPKPTDSALDFATGTGFTAMAFTASQTRDGIDVTDEMLEQARKQTRTVGFQAWTSGWAMPSS
jgi:ubiquinone/menaquinone biosynthesis C-methylase UbiE